MTIVTTAGVVETCGTQDARKYAKTDEGESAGMAWVVKTALEAARRGISQERAARKGMTRELVALQTSLSESEERCQALVSENKILCVDLEKKDLALELLQARVVLDERGEENATLKMELAAARACIAEREDIIEAHVAVGAENKEKLRRARAELLRMRAQAVDQGVELDAAHRQLRVARLEIAGAHSMAAKLSARHKIALGLEVKARRRLRTEHAALQAEHEALQSGWFHVVVITPMRAECSSVRRSR
ncbi:hypothetical protein B0H11DRAFT_2221332 [Mycena galericulata]|nr:hypothetical protein B0H11DRAFT_2221332 [Mycena galericulata]